MTSVFPRFRFFCGKGGVGKTTCAAGAALHAADRGRRVLLISTDPAHSLGDALELTLGRSPRPVPGLRGALWAAELDADRALRRWVEERRAALRTVLERGTYLEGAEVDRFLDSSFPGVDELVGLLEVNRLAEERAYEEVVVDTAPTGHTLRMLSMPETLRRIAGVLDALQARHRVLAGRLGRASASDAGEALIAEIDERGARLAETLRDPERSSLSWVLHAEPLAVAETRDGLDALRAQGLPLREVVVNRLTPAPSRPCRLCAGRRRLERSSLRALAGFLEGVPLRFLPAFPAEPRGLAALRRVGRALASDSAGRELLEPRRPGRAPGPRAGRSTRRGLPLEAPRGLRLLFFGGKGGVGKTTCAAAFALALAQEEPGRRILLLSTDPAHSLADVLAVQAGAEEWRIPRGPAGLRVRELDAQGIYARRSSRYRRAVDEFFDSIRKKVGFEVSHDRRSFRELIELAPPGLDELMALLVVLRQVLPGRGPGAFDLVVVDTAPSGHALRLLEMPAHAQAWVKELLEVLLRFGGTAPLRALGEELVDLSHGLRLLRRTLSDPSSTRFVAVTRAARLPLAETARLVRALRSRLKITVAVVVVNALTPPGCPTCSRAARRERALLRALGTDLGARGRPGRSSCAIMTAPAVAPPPRGARALGRWVRSWAPA